MLKALLTKSKSKKIFLNLVNSVVEVVSRKLIQFFTVNLAIIVFHLFYLSIRFEYLNEKVPFFYIKSWGELQLAPKNYLFLLPITMLLVLVIALIFYYLSEKHYFRYAKSLIINVVTITNILLLIANYEIISKASIPFDSLINPLYLQVLIPGLIAFVLASTIAPQFIEWMTNLKIITHPDYHDHPGMVLEHPSARGGGLLFTLIVIAVSTIFIGFGKELNAIYFAAILLAIVGIFDDYQNTNMKTSLRTLENPVLRLSIIFAIISIVINNGMLITFINNPFNGVLDFSNYQITLFNQQIMWIAHLFTAIWVVWILNLLSWSNGVDGQYGGIVGVAFVVTSILALRFTTIEPLYIKIATLCLIAAGTTFGFLKYTWYPSKIMWGFGAMSAGIIIVATSILSGSKIAASVMIVLIPFLDATVTVTRRLIQRKNPLKGDKGHLHHILMRRGWGVRRISVFYWTSTAFFGFIGILAADQDLPLLILSAIIVVGSAISILNLRSYLKQKTI